MSTVTPIYNYIANQLGDLWYPGLDQRNMQITENQLSSLMNYVGSGVISGWDVEWMSLSQNYPLSVAPGTVEYLSIQAQQQALINAYLTDPLGQLGVQFNSIFPISTFLTVNIASTSSINLAAPGSQIDGVNLTTGMSVLLTNQTLTSNNGLYTYNGSSLVPSATSISPGYCTLVLSGANNINTIWQNSVAQNGAIEFFDAWIQVISVSAGTGIITPFSAQTTIPFYFKYNGESVNYIFSASTFALATQQVCVITSSTNIDYASYNQATFLASVETAQTNVESNIYYVERIGYGTQRNDLVDLSGSLQKALELYFYHHVHLGGANHPSLINLSTNLLLVGQGEPDAPMYYLYPVGQLVESVNLTSGGNGYTTIPTVEFSGDGNGASATAVLVNGSVVAINLTANGQGYTVPPTITLAGGGDYTSQATATVTLASPSIFTWTGGTLQPIGSNLPNPTYGIPTVLINGEVIPNSEYNIVPTSGEIFLKNSLPSGAILQVELPLSPQTVLSVNTSVSGISSAIITLTDGVYEIPGDASSFLRIFTWDSGYYAQPIVTLNNIVINSSLYAINSFSGTIQFNTTLESPYTATSLSILLTYIGTQIQGTLPGKRVVNVNASTFTEGTVPVDRIVGLNHVGEFSLNEPANIIPNHRVFAQGDHYTYYPEILESDGITSATMQFSYAINSIGMSVNIPSPNILFGTKRGLMVTSDGINYSFQSGWNNDMGEPIFFIDNVLQAGSSTNYFNTLYILTNQGQIFSSNNAGLSFNTVNLPIDVNGDTIPATCFYVSTNQVSNDANTGPQYTYSSIFYMGTEGNGLWSATVSDGQTAWEWTLDTAIPFTDNVYSVVNMCTETFTSSDTSGDITAYVFTTYVAASSGFYVNGSLMPIPNNEFIQGIVWLQNGAEANNLLLYTADNVYITHTAQFVVIQTPDTYQTYWIQPFTQFPLSGASASYPLTTVQAVEVNSLSSAIYNVAAGNNVAYFTNAPTIVDGHTLNSGDQILVVNAGVQNGIYVAQSTTSTWELSSTYTNVWNGSNPTLFVPLIWVAVDGSGQIYKLSSWTISVSTTGLSLYNSITTWNQQYIWSMGTTGNPITGAYQIPNYSYYVIITEHEPYLITDNYTNSFSVPSSQAMIWNMNSQGSPTSIIAINNSYIIGSNIGVWYSLNLAGTWNRPQNVFNANDTPTLYDATTGSIVASAWSQNSQCQSFVFSTEQTVWQSFLYENQYTTYNTVSWLPTNAIVTVYINSLPSTIPYALNPAQGIITFVNSLGPNATVTISVIRLGAYITNVGSTPHGELSNYFLVGTSPVAQLSQPYPSTAGLNTLFLSSQTAIPVGTDYIQLSCTAGTAFLPISVDPNTFVISVLSPYTGGITFPALYTNVFIVALGSTLGIEDLISLNQSNETYNFNSIVGSNVLQLSIAMKESNSSLFTDFSTPPTVGGSPNRGPINSLFFDFTTETLDTNASYATLTTGYQPSPNDVASNPVAVYVIYNSSPNINGSGLIVGTDQGIWSYNVSTTEWSKQSDLGGATRVYFITEADGVLTAGTELGVYRQNASNTWSPDPTFVQPTLAYSTGSWNSDTYESWGKSTGLAFVQETTSGFTSDHLAAIDDTNVNGFFLGYYLTEPASSDSSSDSAPSPSVELLVCTNSGLFGVENGTVSGQFSSLLVGRDMFGGSITKTITLPNGESSTIPVEFYNIFTAIDFPASPTSSKGNICLYIGTNNGLYVVRNWRWEAPHDATTGTFTVQSQYFPGKSIYSSAVCQGTDIFGNSANKMFIGTNQCMYRSFDDGTTFQSCERFQTQILPVYAIQVLGSGIIFNNYTASTVLCGTSNGLWISDDDGDNWYTPTVSSGQFNGVISNAQPFHLSSIAQTFPIPSGAGSSPQILQVNAYINVELPNPTSAAYANSMLNTLTAQIYACNSQGVPVTPISIDSGITLPVGANTSLTVSDIEFPGFYTLYVPTELPNNTGQYAVVITENSGGSGAVSVFTWQQSNLPRPYQGLAYAGSPLALIGSGNVTMFFLVNFIAPTTPEFINVNVGQLPSPNANNPGFSTGSNLGCIVNDYGYLTTAFKFATAITVDDSSSMTWADPGSTSPVNTTRSYYIQKLIDAICNRTTYNNYLASYFDFWTFGLSETEQTPGYINSQSLLDLYSNSLFGNGTTSPLFDTTDIALQGLQPQSIIEAMITGTESNSPLNNNLATQENVSALIGYLQSIHALRLQDVLVYWSTLPIGTASPWNGSANTIYLYNDVSSFVVKQWASTFIPVGFVVSDGDDYGDLNGGTANEVSETATNTWLDFGANIYSFGLGVSNLESNLRSMVIASGGKCFDISTTNDWNTAITSLLHGGSNSIFSSTWTQSYDYDVPIFIQSIHTSYIQPTNISNASITTNSVCTIQFQYTLDRIHWTPWTNVPNDYGLEYPTGYVINNFIAAINYQVVLGDGWIASTSTSVQPVVQALYHVEVTPSTQYLVTEPQSVDNGMIFEYLISAAATVPTTANVQFGIIRGNNTDYSYFEPVINNRKACLPNREQGVLFTQEVVLPNLATTTSDYINYTVVGSSGNTQYWADSDIITVYENGTAIDNSAGVNYYGSNGSTGIITFFGVGGGTPQQPSNLVITVTITTPASMYESIGETTQTVDHRTFYASNGNWSPDSTAIVLINNQICRGGYFMNPAQGTINFTQSLPMTDIVTLYIQPTGYFRVGCLITNYSTIPVELTNFGLYYTTVNNNSIIYEYNSPVPPSLSLLPSGGYVGFLPTSPNVFDRVQINYDYYSSEGDVESGTQTQWFRSRNGGVTWVPITAANGLPNYSGRITERLIDSGTIAENSNALFLPGDQISATVIPSNGFIYGIAQSSVAPFTQFSLNPPPIANTLTFGGAGITFNSNGTITIPAGNAITAIYTFTDANGGVDTSEVTWYLRDSSTPFQPATYAPEAPILSGALTTAGQTFNFVVTPIDSNGTGTPVNSEYITIT